MVFSFTSQKKELKTTFHIYPDTNVSTDLFIHHFRLPSFSLQGSTSTKTGQGEGSYKM